ncbi:MAG: type II toxin-antitoxin system HicA family toxin [Anaerolineales bacterium]|nr:type II toxin-antitoxin system HicA family toxin [Anaerolineales bacterium]
MSQRLGPISRRDFIERLRLMGFEGTYSGGRHEFMLRDNSRLILPNPHRSIISVDLLIRLLKQAGISREDWQQPD